MTLDDVTYALAKQVPAMRSGVILHTDYGELPLSGDDAAQVAALVQRLLERKLRQMTR